MALRARRCDISWLLLIGWRSSFPSMGRRLVVLRRILLQLYHDDHGRLRGFGARRLPHVALHDLHSVRLGSDQHHHRAGEATVRAELAEASTDETRIVCRLTEAIRRGAWSHRCQRPAIDSFRGKSKEKSGEHFKHDFFCSLKGVNAEARQER